MNKLSKIAIITTLAGITGFAAINANAGPGRYGYYGNCNQGSMQNGMYKYSKKGFKNSRRVQRDLNLSEEEIKTLVQAKLIMRGNDRLKVGKITAKDDTTYSVQIVTVDDSLVREIEIDRNTGRPVRNNQQ